MNKGKIKKCKNCKYCYNDEYCLINEEYIEDCKNYNCDSFEYDKDKEDDYGFHIIDFAKDND